MLIAIHIMTTGDKKKSFKVGSAKFANSLSPPSIVKKYAPEVKAAKGLKRYREKVNNPA